MDKLQTNYFKLRCDYDSTDIESREWNCKLVYSKLGKRMISPENKIDENKLGYICFISEPPIYIYNTKFKIKCIRT